MRGNDSNKFEQLVSKFEKNNLDLTQIPQDLVDEYGYACLANSLMFKEPQIPKYNLDIAEYVKSHQFETLDSLVNYIKNLPNDVDKLFGIFSYVTQNIKYDEELCKLDKIRLFSLEEIFTLKKAICNGYTSFIEDMTKLVEIDTNRINIKHYSNFSKGKTYDALNWPKKVKSDHASLLITIDGIPFISEPTWSVNNHFQNEKYDFNFQPNLFLIPLYKTLCDHYPIEECKEFLKPIEFPFSHFFQSSKISPFGIQLKTETNPFVKVTCESGYIKDRFSCIGPVNSVGFDLLVQEKNGFHDIPIDGLTSYRIIQTKIPNHPERCRFETYILFPEVGLYQIVMYINAKESLTYYVQNKKKCSTSIPIQYNLFHNVKYIPIKPNLILSTAENGATIRFTISKNQSNILWEIIKLDDNKGFDKNGEKIDSNYGRYIKLEIPFDNERYEILFAVTFPSNGRYCVQFFFEKEGKRGTFEFYTKYYMNVTSIKQGEKYEINPVYYMHKGRKIAPKKFYCDDNEIIVKPNQCYYLVKERKQSIQFKTASINDELYFELRKGDKTVIWPKNFTIVDNFREVSFTIPDEYGEYHLYGWVNKKYCIDLFFLYSNYELEEPSEEELRLLKDLKAKICEGESMEKETKEEKEEAKINKENTEKPKLNNMMSKSDEKNIPNNGNNRIDRRSKESIENVILKRENNVLKKQIQILKEKMIELVKQNEILIRENTILKNNAIKFMQNKNTTSRKSVSPTSNTIKTNVHIVNQSKDRNSSSNAKNDDDKSNKTENNVNDNSRSTPNRSNIIDLNINNTIQIKNDNSTQIKVENQQNNNCPSSPKEDNNNHSCNEVAPIQNINSTPLKVNCNEIDLHQNKDNKGALSENKDSIPLSSNNEVISVQNENCQNTCNKSTQNSYNDLTTSKNEKDNQCNSNKITQLKRESSPKIKNKSEALQNKNSALSNSAKNKASNKSKINNGNNKKSKTLTSNKNIQNNTKYTQSNKIKNNNDIKSFKSSTVNYKAPQKNTNNNNLAYSSNLKKSMSTKTKTVSSSNMINKQLKSNDSKNYQRNSTINKKNTLSNKSKAVPSQSMKSKSSNRSKSNITQMRISDFIKFNIPNNYKNPTIK